MPKVSVITAAYNHAKFVRQMAESVQAQTFRDFEHIVVDDGSTDGTADVLKSFGNEIIYVRENNRGTQAARNTALQISSGDYIALLDSDDVWLPEKLERQMKVFAEFQDAGLVYSFAYMIDSEGNVGNDGKPFGKPVAHGRDTLKEIMIQNPVPALTAVFHRRWIRELGGFDESLEVAADWDLWLRIAAHGPVNCVQEPLALYRLHQSNTWNVAYPNGRFHEDWLRMLEKFENEHPGLVPEVDSIRRDVVNAYAGFALDSAYGRYYRREFHAARQLLQTSVKLRPILIANDRTIRLAAKLLLGERGTELARKGKYLLHL